MTIKEYLVNNILIPESTLDTEDYYALSSECQNILSEWMFAKYGSLKLRKLYEDNANSLKFSVYNLLEAEKYKIQGLYESTLLEYNPIENYNMVEESHDSSHGSNTNTTDVGAQTSNSTETSTVSPYDTASYENNNQVTSNGTTGARSDLMTGEVTGTADHTLTRKGNIGVTTSDQLIDMHRKTLMFNVIDVIAKDIVKLIAIRVYNVEED